MKIAVIAAGGRTGRAFVDAALSNGHEIVAGYYGAPLGLNHERVTEKQCDATNEQDIAELIHGCNAVVSAIGHVRGSAADVQTAAMKHLVAAMKQEGIKRVVSLTGTGVRYDGDKIPLYDWPLNWFISIVDPKRVKDGKDHAAVLAASELDWTIVRVLKLTNASAKGFALTAHGPVKLFSPRGEVAQAMLRVLEEGSYIKAAPVHSS